MKKYSASPFWVTFAYVLVAGSPTVPLVPQSTPSGVHGWPSHALPTSSAGPVYSPAPSCASTAGAAAAVGIAVRGTTVIVRSSKPEPPPNVVVIRIVWFWLAGSAAWALVSWKLTVARAPGARGP